LLEGQDQVYANQTQENAVNFLNALRKACPTRIKTILTDNGTQFTDRFLRADKKASGKHPFDRACAQNEIGHHLIPPHERTHSGNPPANPFCLRQ
jgi:hypothetical protein